MKLSRKISVTGLGYVGLPVAIAFGEHQRVIGYDYNPRRIQELKEGFDRTHEVAGPALKKANLLLTSDPQELKAADFHIIAVPTPIDEAKKPDLTALLGASKSVGSVLKRGDIVVYESTVYPGATEEDCVPVLERASGLKCGADFTVGYSPERINPGDKEHTFTSIVKVVSGQDAKTLDIVAEVYGSVVTAGVHRAASIKVAESSKVIENIQRDVNIALMNELALIFHRMDIDTTQVLAASRTKWNFLPFSPGLVGGHCIGVDPYYMTHRAATLGYTPEVILAGRRINDEMGKYVAQQTIKGLIKQGTSVNGCRVIVLGLTFKENVPDLRNTRVIDIVRELRDYQVDVSIHDPEGDPHEAKEEYGVEIIPLDRLPPADAVIVAVPHASLIQAGWPLVQRLLKPGASLVIDIRGALSTKEKPSALTHWKL